MELHAWQRSPGLFTDLYHLTMAQGHFLSGTTQTEASFALFFRENPFCGGYAIACGLEQVLGFLGSLRYTVDDIAYLAGLIGNDGRPLFDTRFLDYLESFTFEADVDAVLEGTVVFANEPLLRVTGPIVSAQLVESALLNIINFQTLVATKASRVCHAAHGDDVIEFGLRRAQGPDGGLSASRAAFVGGCSATSNTLAGRVFGIPVAGTHAHSWVMLFDDELAAFERYAEALPNNCTLLVDTYDTLRGVARAAEVGKRLAEAGHALVGVRIDSGDLAWLSRRARQILDDAGLAGARIVASNELDEHAIGSLKEDGAAIDVWGVGTKLVTASEQAALGGVYKLTAVRDPGGRWVPRVKVSEQIAKVTTPGVLAARRYFDPTTGRPAGDMVYDLANPPAPGAVTMFDPSDPLRRKRFDERALFEELLVPVVRRGERVYEPPRLTDVAARAREQMALFDASLLRLINPYSYPVGIERGVHRRRTRLVMKAREER